METHGTERISDDMDDGSSDVMEEHSAGETPDDVAILYSWANLQGAKYRDFSASRREYRAQMRRRAAELLREQELKAAADAELAAAAAEALAAAAKAEAGQQGTSEAGVAEGDRARLLSLQEAEAASRKAAAERLEAARRAEAASLAESIARREEREIMEAKASGMRQAARYADSEFRLRQTGVDHKSQIPGQITDPYSPQIVAEGEYFERPGTPTSDLHLNRFRQQREYIDRATGHEHAAGGGRGAEPDQREPSRPRGFRPDEPSGTHAAAGGGHATQSPYSPGYASIPSTPYQEYRRGEQRRESVDKAGPISGTGEVVLRPRPEIPDPASVPPSAASTAADRLTPGEPIYAPLRPQLAYHAGEPDAAPTRLDPLPPLFPTPGRPSAEPAQRIPDPMPPQTPVPPARPRQDGQDAPGSHAQPADLGQRSMPAPSYEAAAVPWQTGPAWLYPAQDAGRGRAAAQPPLSAASETLQDSRERVASRWYALKGVFQRAAQEVSEGPERGGSQEPHTPMLAVFSLAGGVGKTSLVATLGRALSSMGEKVLLADTTSHGLLPFYFGASELIPGVVRTFSPPSGSKDAPIHLVSFDVDRRSADEGHTREDRRSEDGAAQDRLAEDIIQNGRGTNRILLDLSANSAWVFRRVARMNPTILVPLAADMNSVISLESVRRFFHDIHDAEGRPLEPFYLLNQFDASLPLQLDVREVLREQLGDRLLPFVIHRAASVSEALAEGMTVVDYAPDAPVAQDYLRAAAWIRGLSAPANAGFRNVRWSER